MTATDTHLSGHVMDATLHHDAVQAVAAGVEWLQSTLDELLALCTDPDGLDLAALLYDVQAARIRLQQVERDVELAAADAITERNVDGCGLRVERYRSTDRKSWDHAEWQRKVREKVLRKAGLTGAQGVINAAGEVVEASVLYELLTAVQSVHGSTAPKSGSLRALGMDPADYCESSPGAWHVKVQRIVDESEGQ